MKAERWQQVDKLFDAALEVEPERRALFLDAACAGDQALRAEVDSLLEAYGRAGKFIEAPAMEVAARIAASTGSHTATGRSIGPYRILSLLGVGGMGEVYLARDERLGRRLALKLLPARLTQDAEKVLRFQQEARTASALNHPNIITIYEIGQTDDAHYIATELIEGETLRARMTRGRIEVCEALNYIQQVAAALIVAHTAGIIHRDIKPENIMLRPDGYVKVLDFGIAKLLESDSPEDMPRRLLTTTPGIVLGTISYMSPEQARGFKTDARTDIWSLGVVLYEALAGRLPFAGETGSDILSLILQKEPPPLADSLERVAPELQQLVTKALCKDREARYPAAADLLTDVRRLLAQEAEALPALIPPAGNMAAQASSGQVRQGAVAPPLEQRKQATVLFADLAGLVELSETLDAEETGELLNKLWQHIDAVITEHGGEIEKHMGDTVMALWGARAAHEDDPERAIHASLVMQDAVSRFIREHGQSYSQFVTEAETGEDALPPQLMRVGISTGSVYLGAVSTTGEMAASGAPVNLAHRLQQAAHIGGILISRDTYAHVRGIFDVRMLEVMSVKGKSEPLESYVVERAKPRAFRLGTRGVEGVETRMIGREAELEKLLRSLKGVLEDKELCAVTVTADAGVGKSRLLYEFSNRVELLPESVRVFNGRAREATRGLPYALLRDVLSFRFEIQDGDAPHAAREKLERGLQASSPNAEEARAEAHCIGHLMGFDFSDSPHLRPILDDARQIRDRAFQCAAHYFKRTARANPLVLYLEDIHWADDGSLDFVDYLMRECESAPLFILCLTRPALFERRPAWGEGHSAHTRLNLQPLSKGETRKLLEEILRRATDVPLALREMVVAQAEGNPFYVEEIIKMLIDRRVIVAGEDAWSIEPTRLTQARVPPTLTGVLQARLDELTGWEKFVLQRASVLGRVFWASALERLGAAQEIDPNSGEATPDLAEALEKLRRREFIYRREASAFPGTSEYLFKHALLRDVTYESLLKRERRVLHHAAAEWLTESRGDRADEYAATIAEHYEHAEESERAAHWFGRAARQARQAYAPAAAIDYYLKALEFLQVSTGSVQPDEEHHARRLEWYEELGELLIVQARFAEATNAYNAMLQHAEEAGSILAQARAWNGLAVLHERLGENRALTESAQRAAALAQLMPGDSPQAKLELARALNMQGHACYRLGEPAALIPFGEQALALCAELGAVAQRERAFSLKIIGAVHQMLCNFEQSFEYTKQALALYRELGNRREEGYTLNNLGETARLSGDYEMAMSCYQEALALYHETGERMQQMMATSNIGAARVGQEQYAEAEAGLRRVIEMAGEQGYYGLSETYRYLAESLLAQERIAEALEAARRALELGQEKDCQEHIGAAWRVLGMIAARSGKPLSIGCETRDAQSCFAESLRIFTEISMEAERARTLREWARLADALGELERAAVMKQEASETFARLGIKQETR